MQQMKDLVPKYNKNTEITRRPTKRLYLKLKCNNICFRCARTF